MAFPDDIFLGLSPSEGTSRGRSGVISIEKLAKLANYHTVRRICVGTESFGLVDMPKKKAAARVADLLAGAGERCARLQEKNPGVELRMQGRIHLTPPQHNETSWTLYIHSIQVSLIGTDKYYPVY